MSPILWVIVGGIVLGGSAAIIATAAVLAVVGALKFPTIIRAISRRNTK